MAVLTTQLYIIYWNKVLSKYVLQAMKFQDVVEKHYLLYAISRCTQMRVKLHML